MFQRSPRASARRAVAWPRTVVVSSLLALACSAPPGSGGDYDDGPDEFGGALPGTPGAAAPTNPGAATAPGVTPTPSNPAPSAPPVASSGGGEQNPAAGAPITPSTTPPPSNTGANAGAGVDGAGGSSMVPPDDGDQGAGGSSMTPPQQQPPANQQPDPTTPVTPVTPPAPVIDTVCPDGAIFCSGFEQTSFPAGTMNIIGGTQFADAFLLDTTEVHAGNQSFFLPQTNQAFSYRVMAIPVPVQAFWARIFVRTDTLLGDADHDGIFAISSGDLTVDNNNETRIEFSEQEGTIVLNRSTDQITFPVNRPATLAANTWHCVEARFDGTAGDVEVFGDGQQIISSLGNAQFRFQVQTFRIGTLQFHSPRNVWFDDVVIDTERVGCN